jgi:hypothetical protein
MPRSAIIWTRSRKLSLNVRYHRTHRTIISWSKCRPLKSSCAEAGSVIQAVTAGSRAFQVCTRTLARKRQDLLGTWSEIIHECISDAGARCLTFLKVDPTSAFLQLTSKPEEIEYCYEYLTISSRQFSPQSPKLITHRKASQLLMHR